MNLEEFGRQAEIWGGDLARWPEAQQDAARRIAKTKEGQRMLADASYFDEAIANAFPEVSDRRVRGAAFAVLSRVIENDKAPRVPWTVGFAGWYVPTGGILASAALGVAIALLTPQLAGDQSGVLVISAILDSGSFAANLVVQ